MVFQGPITALYAFLLAVGVLVFFLRFGFVALIVAVAVRGLADYAVTDSWSAWYAQAAVASLVMFVGLTLYGVWAATAPSGSRATPAS